MLSLGPATAPEPLHRGQKLNWNHSVALIGEKFSDPAIHFCEICELPILVYGRMLPCKHIFCYDCALKAERKCVRCNDPVTRVERCELGQIFMCTYGAPKHSYKACRRTYLSQRDLQAHISHRHAPKPGSTPAVSMPSSGPPPTSAAVMRTSHTQRPTSHRHHGSQSTTGISTHPMITQSAISSISTQQRPPQATTSTRTNLITIQLTGEHSVDNSASQQGNRRINPR